MHMSEIFGFIFSIRDVFTKVFQLPRGQLVGSWVRPALSEGHRGASWSPLGTMLWPGEADLGHLGASWGHLGGHLEASRGHLGDLGEILWQS